MNNYERHAREEFRAAGFAGVLLAGLQSKIFYLKLLPHSAIILFLLDKVTTPQTTKISPDWPVAQIPRVSGLLCRGGWEPRQLKYAQ